MSVAAPKKITYSAEQEAIFAAEYNDGEGTFIAIANAGSGKTESSAEKVVRAIVCECGKKGKPKPTGDELGKILLNFLIVTFTKKAAGELDARIKKKLAERGFPTPTQHGKPSVVCRTLDSYLQLWTRNPSFFSAWMRNDEQYRGMWQRMLQLSSPALREFVEKRVAQISDVEKRATEQLRATFLLWDKMIVGSRQDALIDLLVRREFSAGVPDDTEFNAVMDGFSHYLAAMDPSKPETLKMGYLDALAQRFEDREARMNELRLRSAGLRDPKLGVDEATVLEAHEEMTMRRREFLSIHEIARARDYDPEKRPFALNHAEIIRRIAASQHCKTLVRVHSLACGYKRIKRHFGLMDFGDFMQAFLDTIDAIRVWNDTAKMRGVPFQRDIIERGVEYPVLGIRRKYVIWDENQDNNPAQFAVQQLLRPHRGVPYFSLGVGDVFQSLYGFRGSSPRQFVQQIETLRKTRPKHLLSLTCSFRSAKRIVELGNSIIERLCDSDESATPSRTVYSEKGEIIVAPLHQDVEEESAWVISKIDELRRKHGGSFMLLVRADAAGHPVNQQLKELGYKDVSVMTVHASKGLEADHVFILSACATKFPDPRGEIEQEANAWYVACTRPRRTLVLSAFRQELTSDGGVPVVKMLGPSPYFTEVPLLRDLARAASWTNAELNGGHATHRAAVATYISGIKSALHELEAEAQQHFGQGITPEEPRSAKYLGAISGLEHIPVSAAMAAPDQTEENAAPPSSADCEKLFRKLKDSFFGRGGKPRLDMHEKRIGLYKGWLQLLRGQPVITSGFRDEIRRRSSSAA